MKTSQRITRAADRIEAVLDAHRAATANPSAMGELRAAAAELAACDAFASSKLVELMDQAQVFYGRQSLFRLPGRSQRLWRSMREELLDLLRMRARVLEAQGD
ncbi:MAG TPA: hypothetical protein VJ743_04735 [Albitalea sp.]|nr:hypothetical protein [Albitalea sp.]